MAMCNKCHKEEASVRLTTIINGEKAELFLCELCAKQEQSLSMGEIFKNPLDWGIIQKQLEESLEGHVGEVVSPNTLQEITKDLQNAIGKLALSPSDVEALTPSKACPKCGITWDEIKKTSKFGCPYDYEFFEEDFAPTMKRLHLGGTKHVGKVPTHLNISVSRQVEALEQELTAAVKEEQYEKAAELRDKIKALKVQG
jgi:protein arginine kinase activator